MTFLCGILLVGSLFLAWKRGVTPASVLLLFYTLSFSIYWTIFDFSLRKGDVFGALGLSYTAAPLSEYASNSSAVILLYFAIACPLLAMLLISPQKLDLRPESSSGFVLGRRLVSAAWLGMAAYGALTAWHTVAINWGSLGEFTDYLSLKHPEGLGLNSPILRAYHFLMKTGGPLIFGTGLLAFASGHRLLGVLLVAGSMYGFVFNSITSSRYVIAYPAIAIAAALIRRRYVAAMLGFLALIVLFNMSIVGRSQSIHGFLAMDQNFFVQVAVSLPQAVLGLVLNVFDTFLVFGAALSISPEYSPAYSWLSFSPLPSALDGFDLIAGTAPRISVSVPFSAYAEAFLMSPAAALALLLTLLAFVVVLQRLVRTSGPLIGAAALSWCLVVNQLVCQYPIRNSYRFILLTVAVGVFILVQRRRRHAKTSVASSRSLSLR